MTIITANTNALAYNLNLEMTDVLSFIRTPAGRKEGGGNALHHMARDGDILMAEAVIRQGAAVNQQDACGKRPLHEAAACGQTEMTRFLIARGAQVDAPAHPLSHTPLYIAVQNGHRATAKLLLEKGAWPGVTDCLSGQGLLHMAAAKGDVELAGLLVAAGASVFHEDDNGLTARDYAARHNHADMERIFLKLMAHHARG